MKTRNFLATSICLITAGVAFARFTNRLDYKQMADQADLIVIATPTGNTDLPGPATVPNVIATDFNTHVSHVIQAIQVDTSFRPVAVLKGKLPDKATSFKLLHLRFADPADGTGMNAAMLVTFKPNDGSQYLLFLKAGPDGAYEPVNGQTDPAWSVEKLQQTLPPN